MNGKQPQPTGVLISRLQRVARWLDRQAETQAGPASFSAPWRARANTCWQAAARLEELARKGAA